MFINKYKNTILYKKLLLQKYVLQDLLVNKKMFFFDKKINCLFMYNNNKQYITCVNTCKLLKKTLKTVVFVVVLWRDTYTYVL